MASWHGGWHWLCPCFCLGVRCQPFAPSKPVQGGQAGLQAGNVAAGRGGGHVYFAGAV